MQNSNDNNNTIIELESRLAFQEDLIASLDSRMAEQQRDIDQLQLQLVHLNRKFKDLERSTESQQQQHNEKPPHY